MILPGITEPTLTSSEVSEGVVGSSGATRSAWGRVTCRVGAIQMVRGTNAHVPRQVMDATSSIDHRTASSGVGSRNSERDASHQIYCWGNSPNSVQWALQEIRNRHSWYQYRIIDPSVVHRSKGAEATFMDDGC